MARVEVRAVETRADRRRFDDFPYAHYADDPHFVAPLRIEAAKLLNPRKNAFFEHGRARSFIATDSSGTVVGRIAGIVNGMHLEKYDDGVGFFGFFESVDDEAVSDALFEAAEAWLLEQGLTTIRGPVNPSMNDVAGLLVDGFESPPYVLMAHNPAYYERLIEARGFERAMTMWAYFIHRKYSNIERLRRGVGLVHRRTPGITLRNLDMDRFDEEARIIRSIYNDAWSDNWGFVPMTEAEFGQLASDMEKLVDPRMGFILEVGGEPAGFAIAIPNINQVLHGNKNGRLLPTTLVKLLAADRFRSIQECRLPLLGVRKEYQGRGLDAVLILEIGERVPPLGYPACEMSWVLENNPAMANALRTLGGVKDKEYAVFERRVVE